MGLQGESVLVFHVAHRIGADDSTPVDIGPQGSISANIL